MKPINIAIVGASGMVGQMFLKVLEERKLPIANLYLFASARSAGQTVKFNGQDIVIKELAPDVFDRGIDFALFGVEGDISKKYAPIAARAGCVVVDNSSAWRMADNVPLVVPEVNPVDLAGHPGIVANPNCCATPAVVALKPLLDTYGLQRVVISTYQSVSGAGVGGMADLEKTLQGEAPTHFPYPIAGNLIPHIDTFHDCGYTGEEKKLMAEIRKILHASDLPLTATTVRVPVEYGHSLSMNVTLGREFDLEDVRTLLKNAPGIILQDDGANNEYPMPLHAAGTDNVYVGRLRRDDSFPNSLNLWVVADNTRKGAATNAVQIVEALLDESPNF
ncbi:MAG: aspartate-semialdehyde dehydrogenase [Defluviitaleaceae bacterium]|nr:aspartate-semialdehyde dehydrogenase [Defluviitaleaceae bacterium]